MKERPDKRDFLTLAAIETGFEVDWLDGVRPSELRQKAMPNVSISIIEGKIPHNPGTGI